MEILNKDFARLNADASNTPTRFQSIAGGLKIKFCLANRDPNGNPTTGIERKLTTKNGFPRGDNSMKEATDGLVGWSRNKYLNIWTCNLTEDILGFATFPGGTASLDGVVFLHSVVGLERWRLITKVELPPMRLDTGWVYTIFGVMMVRVQVELL
ncbi:MAG: hypothetical protein IPN09_08325 [Bacteroidetes bacterium]|nr:hypothetical protein [Bacteroidota bacterium]